jgi:hypothetical protein
MGFKMKGSPAKLGTISGTAGHSSALKMKAEADAASALKQMELTKEETKGMVKRVDKDGNPTGLDLSINATGTEVTTKSGKKIKLDPEGKYGKSHKAIQDLRWKKGDEASGGTLNELVKQRKSLTKGTKEYADVQNKINKALGSKKVHEGKVKQSNVSKDKNVEGKNVVKGAGDASKRLTPEQKTAEKVKIEKANKQIKEGKKEGDKNKRDKGQLEKGEIRSGRDNAKTGTVISRWFGRQKVKRNKKQLAKRAAKNA